MKLASLEGRKPIFDRRYALELLSADEKYGHYCLGDSVVLPYGSFMLNFLRFENTGYLRGDEYDFHFWSAMLKLEDIDTHDFERGLAERVRRDPSAELIYFDDVSGSYLKPLYGFEWSPRSWRRSAYRWCWVLDLVDFNMLRDLVDVSDDRAYSKVLEALRQLWSYSSNRLLHELYSRDDRGYTPARLSDRCCLVFADLGFGLPEYHNRNLPVVRVRAYDVLRTDVYEDNDGDDSRSVGEEAESASFW